MKMRNLLFEITKDCNCHNKDKPYCTLIELFCLNQKNPRCLTQLKLIEKYKYILSEKFKTEISWEDATKKWISDGFAILYDKHYDPNLSISQLFEIIVQRNLNI